MAEENMYEYLNTDPLKSKVTEGGSPLDYFKTFSSIGMRVSHPELYGAERDTNFDITKYQDELATMDDTEFSAVIGANSDANFQNRKERIKLYKESMERIENDSLFVQVAGGLGASIIDPINLIPVGGFISKAATLTKASSMLGKAAAIGTGTAAVGAASNVASEYLMEKQGLPHDYVSAAMYGAVLGFGLGGVGSMLNHSGYSKELSTALKGEDEAMLKEVEFKFDPTTEGKEGIPPRVEDVKMTAWMPESVKNFFSSETAIAYGSKVDSIRGMMGKLSHLAYGTKNGIAGSTTMKDYMTKLDGDVHTAQYELQGLHRAEQRAGKFKGDLEEYYEKVGTDFSTKANKQELDVQSDPDFLALKSEMDIAKKEFDIKYERNIKKAKDEADKVKIDKEFQEVRAKMDEAFNTRMDSLYARHKPKLTKSETLVNTYYSKMLQKGKEAKIPELEGLSNNRLYFTRQWDYQKIKDQDVDVVASKIANGMKMHPANVGLTDDTIAEASMKFTEDLLQRGFDSGFNDLGIFSAKGEVGIGKNLEGRKIRVDTSQVMDLLHTNSAEVMGGYHYWMRGQVAVRQALPELQGTPMKAKAGDNDLMEEFKSNYVRPIRQEVGRLKGEERAKAERELTALVRVFDDLMGFRRLAKDTNSRTWTGTRFISNIADTTMSGMFGLNQMLEIPAAMWATKFNRLFSREFGTLFADVHKVLASGEKSSNKFINELVLLGRMSAFLEQQGVNRITDAETFFNVSKFEHKHQKFNQKLFKVNGMRTMTAWLEAMTASNTILKLRDIGKLTEADSTLLKGWGINEKTLREIQGELKTHLKFKDGKIQSIGLENMSPGVQDKLGAAINRSVESGVIQGDAMHLPDWMIKANPVVKLLSKFLRFPIAANEILLKKGITEDRAGWMAASIGSTIMAMGLHSLIEEAEIQAGVKSEADRKYSWEGGEGLINLSAKGLGYVGPLGLGTTLYEKTALLTGLPQPGMRYTPSDPTSALIGPAASLVKNIHGVSSNFLEGKFDSYDAWSSLKRMTPLNNMPLYGAGLNTLIEDETIDY